MADKKINVAIIFGGKSTEHEVSLQSAKNVFEAIDKEKYNPILIGIDKTGRWLLNNSSQSLLGVDNSNLIGFNESSDAIALVPQSGGKISDLTGSNKDLSVDVAFPILHGPLGEDGTVQGLLKLANIPFVGSGVLGSAVGMDKDVMKRLLRDAGLPIGKFVALKAGEPIPAHEEIKNKLGAIFFIKPANAGSSVGVSKAHNEAEYLTGVGSAFNYDVKVVLEEYIDGREIECSVLGNDQPIASIPGEVITKHEFYSYEAKYLDENGAILKIPAELSAETIKQIQDLAVKTFLALSAEGLGRVDFFLKESGEVIINEINTIPGFTKISMYPKLWEASGISYAELIDRLIQLAIERFEKEQKIKTNYIE
ncbi:MAG: D-alanine--D-alanine ligase [Patescibacteria group bacterium]